MTKIFPYILAMFYGIHILVTEFAFDSSVTQIETLYSRNFGIFNIVEYFSIFTFLACLFFAYHKGANKRKRHENRKLNNLMIAFFLVVLISFLRVSIEVESLQILYELRRLLPFFLSYYFVYVATLDKSKNFRLILFSNFAFGGIKGVEGIFKFLRGDLIPISGGLSAIFPGWKESLVFLSLICFAIGILIFSKKQSERHFVGMAILPMLFSFTFSYRRTFWVGILVAFVIVLLRGLPNLSSAFKRNSVFVILLPLLLILSTPFITNMSADVLASSPNIVGAILNPEEDSSVNYRVWESTNAIANISRGTPLELLFGIGIGKEFEILLPLPRISQIPTMIYVHNTYVWLCLKLGIIGVSIYSLILFQAVKLSWRLYKNASFALDKSLSLGFLGIFIAVSFVGVAAPFFSEAGCSAWLGYLLGSLSSIYGSNAQLLTTARNSSYYLP